MESSSFDRKGQIHHSTFSIFNSKFSIHTAVFAFFAGVAVQYAGAKHGGTNAPPNGASPPQMMGLEEIVQLCNCANAEYRRRGFMTSEELENRTAMFAARIVKVCEALPQRRLGASHFADQLFRSGTSVAANYAEAVESESRKDFIHKLKIAMKELSETRTWLKVVSFAGYLDGKLLSALIDESVELTRIFAASVRTAHKTA